MKQPDPKLHKYISFIKSGLRVVAGMALINGLPVIAGTILITAGLILASFNAG